MDTADATQARRFADFALSIAGCGDVATSRRKAVQAVSEYLDVPWVAMTRHQEGTGVHYIAANAGLIKSVVRAAASTHEGLGWQLYRDNTVIVSDDLLAETRWPRFSRAVTAATPLRSALAVPMRIDEQTVGALLVYADAPRRFDARLVEMARALADEAGLALCYVCSRERASGLAVALRTNREIGIAIGIVMERLRIPEEQAWNLLVKSSQNRHIKLRDLAAHVVETGQLPPAAPE